MSLPLELCVEQWDESWHHPDVSETQRPFRPEQPANIYPVAHLFFVAVEPRYGSIVIKQSFNYSQLSGGRKIGVAEVQGQPGLHSGLRKRKKGRKEG